MREEQRRQRRPGLVLFEIQHETRQQQAWRLNSIIARRETDTLKTPYLLCHEGHGKRPMVGRDCDNHIHHLARLNQQLALDYGKMLSKQNGDNDWLNGWIPANHSVS
jgi:hypothetical protein